METKDKLEALQFMSTTHRLELDNRRKYEWHALILLLTFFVLSVTAEYRTDVKLPNTNEFNVIVWFAVMGLALITTIFLALLHVANAKNKTIAERAERELDLILADETRPIPTLFLKPIAPKWAWANWSWVSQALTILFIAVVTALTITGISKPLQLPSVKQAFKAEQPTSGSLGPVDERTTSVRATSEDPAFNDLAHGLLSGFFGAILAVILSYFGALQLQRREQRSRQRGAGRALVAELETNRRAVEKLARDLSPAKALSDSAVSYSDGVWREQLPLVAQLLDWNQLQMAARGYFLWPGLCATLEATSWSAVRTVQDVDTNRERHERIRSELNSLAEAFRQASEVVAKRVLNARELEEFVKMGSPGEDEGPKGI
jgi:hypothetical protein